MAGRNKPITFRIFIGGVPLEEIPEKDVQQWKERAWARVEKAANRYCRENPEALETLRGKDYAEFLPAGT